MQQVDDPREAFEPLDLMAAALERAAQDAGEPALLSAADSIWVPRGFWAYSSPGQLLGERFGASRVRHIVSEVGVLQTSLLGHVASAIARGESEVAMIVGAEARDRSLRFEKQGIETPMTLQADCVPDEILRPKSEIMSRFEIELGLITPALQFSIIDNALRAHEGQSLKAYREEVGKLWAGLNRAAVANPDAWIRTPMSAEEIVSATESNRMLSFPYTRSLVSQWNVNQAAGLILCTVEKARRLGLSEDRFIFPLSVIDSEAMLPLSERRELHRSPGFEKAFDRTLSHANCGIEEIDHLELYSCFPAAVRVQQRALGLDNERPVTVTGGMTFGGGPLNNFVLQAWVKMVKRLREDGGTSGLVSAVSGFMTKQGVSLLGPEPRQPFLFDQVTRAVQAEQRTMTVDLEADGRGYVSSYTVVHDRDGKTRVVLFVDLDEERRTLRVVVEDDDLALEAATGDLSGREVTLGSGGKMNWS